MKRLFTTLAISALVIVAIISGFFLLNRVPESVHFSLVGGDVVADYESLVLDEASRKLAYQQIKDVDKNTDVEEYFRILAVAQNYSILGEGRKSYAALLEAIELSPEKSAAFNMLGNVLVKMGNLSSARASFELAVEKESALFTNHIALAAFLREYFPKDTDSIRRAYEYGIEKNSGNLTIRKEQASWFEEIGDISAAIKAWEVVYEYGKSPAVLDRINALKAQR
jgi:tetratricopeptide (TPR) repeat protein